MKNKIKHLFAFKKKGTSIFRRKCIICVLDCKEELIDLDPSY